MSAALNQLGMVQMAREIREGRTTSETIVRSCLDRIDLRENAVGAFACFDKDAVISAARQADQSKPKGPLHGVPFGIKDIIDTDQFPTGWGTTFYDGFQPTRNASCVELFIGAGGIPFGKTVTTEFAYLSLEKPLTLLTYSTHLVDLPAVLPRQ